jgi:hypothetical protein
MNANGGGVIYTLRDRLAIEQEIWALLNARSEDEFTRRAQRVAGSGDQVVPVILHTLARSDARMLGALGTVASFYPHRQEILNKLYEAAADIERSDRERMSAMLILERFLGEAPDPYLVGTLDDPQHMAVESFREMLREGALDPFVLAEYASVLAAQPEETFPGAIETLLAVGKADAVPVLCLLAQENVDALARAALLALGQIYHPDSAHALQALLPMLRPDLRPLGERSLRKLRLSSVPVEPLPGVANTWRTLVSPVDGEGYRVVWFIHDPDPEDNCRFLGLSVHDEEGIRQAYGRYDVPAHMLPEPKPLGQVHQILLQQEDPSGGMSSRDMVPPEAISARGLSSRSVAHEPMLHMLEADFNYGRSLVCEAQTLTFQQGRPLPVVYRLLGSWLWGYDATGVRAGRGSPFIALDRPDQLGETAALLSYPAFEGWIVDGEQVLKHAAAVLQSMPHVFPEGLKGWAVLMALDYFDEEVLRQLRGRLEAMAEWFERAGEAYLARLTLAAASTVTTVPPQEHPFTLRMAEMGLHALMEHAQRQ